MTLFKMTKDISRDRPHPHPTPNPINTQGGDKMAAISRRIFSNEILRILIQISLKFVPNGPINNEPTLVQIMAWRHKGAKPLSEPMMV